MHPSLDDLVVPSSPRSTISIPNLVRTPDRHSPLQLRRDPTTERHGGFGLLRLRPWPMHPSLDDLVVPSSPRSTISIPNLVRTPDRHSPMQLRSPELKRFASLSLPAALQRLFTGAIPSTERHGGFGLLRLRPWPMHPSLDDLVVPSSPRSTISIPNLVRTPDRHSPLQLRSPELKRFASLSLPVTWITGARHRTRRRNSLAHRAFEFDKCDVIKQQTGVASSGGK
ncbi:hypothetical protein JOQ06_005017 [Pogonophryne albipinna]|uniref:Uncharacterized protein n=1 Tax=Pogonophryne albipinna TaxID=1090488 RepID=A0AAD6ARD5_9TELE|nr:hypothetical protein JOQ06_005017 [Pogonophryne albipinna]